MPAIVLRRLGGGVLGAAVAAAPGCGDDGGTGTPYLPTGSSTSTGEATADSTGGGTQPGGTGSTSSSLTEGTGSSTSDTGATTEPSGTSGASGTTGGAADEVCYPGPDLDWSVCLPVVAVDPPPPDYDYPPAYQDNPNYRPPIRFLDLASLDGTTKLAPNFRLDELAQLAKGPYAVVQPHAVEEIQLLRDQVGPIVVKSGYRSPAYNQGVGGATFSRHMYGDAFDMTPTNVSLETFETLCNDAGAMAILYQSWVHCDWRFDPVDEVFFGPEADWMPIAPEPGFAARLERAGAVYTAPALGFDEGPPLRRWTALSADGRVLARATGPSFVPPPGTAVVTVDVGGVVFLSSADAPR